MINKIIDIILCPTSNFQLLLILIFHPLIIIGMCFYMMFSKPPPMQVYKSNKDD
jgi:hypothetical protein